MLALRRIAFPMFIALVLFSAACQTSTVIATLENVISAAEIAVPVIAAATHMSPATSAAIVSYLQEVNIATEQAATILAGSGTTAQKATQVVQAFAKIAAGCNCVPAGTPQEVVAVIQAVAQAVQNFLTNFQTPAPLAGVGNQPGQKPGPSLKVTASDRTALTNIRMRAVQNAVKLKGVSK
jgi:hypothetical protein